jgi:hypothetical protein
MKQFYDGGKGEMRQTTPARTPCAVEAGRQWSPPSDARIIE